MDMIMSTSINLLDQNFNANDVDIMVFEPSVLFPPPQLGGDRWHGPTFFMLNNTELKKTQTGFFSLPQSHHSDLFYMDEIIEMFEAVFTVKGIVGNKQINKLFSSRNRLTVLSELTTMVDNFYKTFAAFIGKKGTKR